MAHVTAPGQVAEDEENSVDVTVYYFSRRSQGATSRTGAPVRQGTTQSDIDYTILSHSPDDPLTVIEFGNKKFVHSKTRSRTNTLGPLVAVETADDDPSAFAESFKGTTPGVQITVQTDSDSVTGVLFETDQQSITVTRERLQSLLSGGEADAVEVTTPGDTDGVQVRKSDMERALGRMDVVSEHL